MNLPHQYPDLDLDLVVALLMGVERRVDLAEYRNHRFQIQCPYSNYEVPMARSEVMDQDL